MRTKEVNLLINHFNKHFEQNDGIVFSPEKFESNIGIALYKPNDKYPFWKLVSLGASEHKMNVDKYSLGNRNEYIMAIDPDEDMTNPDVVDWYLSRFFEVAAYARVNDCVISYGHSIEWYTEDEEEMVGAFIELPQIFESTGILNCKLSTFKTAVCLLIVLLNRSEIDKLMEIGPENFSYYLFPEEGNTAHFLCERTRSNKF